MNVDYFSTLKADSKPRYTQKLDIVRVKDCPYRLPADTSCNIPMHLPEIEYPNIYNYLINTPSTYVLEMKEQHSF